MDRENLNGVLARYLQKFEMTNGKPHEESFKWQAIARFRKYWNLDAVDFAAMFEQATRDFAVIIDGSSSAPTSGIRELLKKPEEIENVRNAFRLLFAEDGGDLSRRQKNADAFIGAINARIVQYWGDSHLYPQTMRSAIGYLTMAKPDENYFYLWEKADNWANCVEFEEDIGSGGSFSLPAYYRMCDALVEEIRSNPKIEACNQKRLQAALNAKKDAALTEADYAFRDGLHTLAYDIIYCATTYNLYLDMPHYPKGLSKRLQRAKERASLSACEAALAAAQAEYDRAFAVKPADLSGRTVLHKTFGEGVILTQEEKRQTVDFGGTVKTFLFPDVYINKLLTPAHEADISIFEESVRISSTQSAAEKDLKIKQANFQTAKAAFEKNWVKNAKAEMEKENDGSCE